VGLIELLASERDCVGAGVEAALHTPRWSRQNMPAARLLLLYRSVDFLDDSVPASVAMRASRLNEPLLQALRAYARHLYGAASVANVRRVGFAVIDIPYGAVHRHLSVGKELPGAVDGLVAEAAEAVLLQRSGR
jgi:hypothetical protein